MTYTDCTTTSRLSLPTKPITRAKYGLVQGAGINDAIDPVRVDGKIIKSYNIWRNMLIRCYSVEYQKKHPTYTDCTVAEEWLSFTAFKEWFANNYIKGYQLDKDILFPGNKVYSPETCVFVPQAINKLLVDSEAARGEYPLGVHFRKDTQKYVAQIKVEVGQRYHGSFPTPLEAHRVWQLTKSDTIEAAKTNNPRIRAALDKRVAQLRDDHANGRITVKL